MAANLASKLDWSLANPKWAATLNPLLANPLVNGHIISDIKVVTGLNVINHGLGRDLQGYMVILNNAAVTFFDSQSTNQRAGLTLLLTASGPAIISLYVF